MISDSQFALLFQYVCCPECGRGEVVYSADEKLWDCHDCAIWFSLGPSEIVRDIVPWALNETFEDSMELINVKRTIEWGPPAGVNNKDRYYFWHDARDSGYYFWLSSASF